MRNFKEISKGCAQALLLIQTFFCFLLALCAFCFAVLDLQILKQYNEEDAAKTLTGDVFIIVGALLVMIVAVFGCIGAVKENVKILYLYIGFVMMMLILDLLIVTYVYMQRYGMQFKVTDSLREDFYRNVTEETREQHDKVWDDLQATYGCCGLNGPEDYTAVGRHVALGCCYQAYRTRSEDAHKLLFKTCVETATYYKYGCVDMIMYVLQSDTVWLLGVTVFSVWIQAAGIVLALWVSSHLKNSAQVYKYTSTY